MTKLKNSKAALWGIVAGVVVLFFVVSALLKTREMVVDETAPTTNETCTESAVKQSGTNLYTCIDGEWIYTGQNDNNKG